MLLKVVNISGPARATLSPFHGTLLTSGLLLRITLTFGLAIAGYHLFGQTDIQNPNGPDNDGQSAWLGPSCQPDEATRFSTLSQRARPLGVDSVIPRLGGNILRTAYVIPGDRLPQPNAERNLQHVLVQFQSWYRDQMERYGFGQKTFRFETEEDGETPRIHIVQLAEAATILRTDLWNQTVAAAVKRGVPVWSPGEVWWLIPETHVQAPDGSVTGGTFLGTGNGSGDGWGVAMVGGDALARFDPRFLSRNDFYKGEVIPEIGPYPLAQDKSFPWFEGETFSSISSSALGGALHEISHAFGLYHDFRDDDNFKGNLMGNGLRGYRGSIFPALYPVNDCRLSYGAALALSKNRYFNSDRYDSSDAKVPPHITSPASLSPVGGNININFHADDPDGFTGAWLIWKGDLVDEFSSWGTTLGGVFATPYYTAGTWNNYEVVVFNNEGIKQAVSASIFVEPGYNRAPRPFLNIQKSEIKAGEPLYMSTSWSSDPDGTTDGLLTTWDLNGDGILDTVPSLSKGWLFAFNSPGDRLVRAYVTDSMGATARSSLISVRVLPANSPIGPGNIGYDPRRNSR